MTWKDRHHLRRATAVPAAFDLLSQHCGWSVAGLCAGMATNCQPAALRGNQPESAQLYGEYCLTPFWRSDSSALKPQQAPSPADHRNHCRGALCALCLVTLSATLKFSLKLCLRVSSHHGSTKALNTNETVGAGGQERSVSELWVRNDWINDTMMLNNEQLNMQEEW